MESAKGGHGDDDTETTSTPKAGDLIGVHSGETGMARQSDPEGKSPAPRLGKYRNPSIGCAFGAAHR